MLARAVLTGGKRREVEGQVRADWGRRGGAQSLVQKSTHIVSRLD